MVVLPLTGRLVGLFGPGEAVADLAVTYLHIALLGAVPLLLMLAATGVLRGLQDTRTPLVVAVLGNAANIVLNLVLVYGVGCWSAGHRRLGPGHPARPAGLGRWHWCGWWSTPPGRSTPRCGPTFPGSDAPGGPAYP